MKVEFFVTGDPWHDFGLCELYEILKKVSNSKVNEYDSGFTFETNLTLSDFVGEVEEIYFTSDKWNNLHPRYQESKNIPGYEPKTINGRRISGEKYYKEVTKEEWEHYNCKGTMPSKIRNYCLRLPTIPMTPKDLQKNFDNELINVFKKIFTNEKIEINQGINPLVAKQHNNVKVRGFGGSNGYSEASYKYVLPCYLTSLSHYLPFVKAGASNVDVIIPYGLNFTLLYDLYNNLKYSLIHPDFNGNMSTNLKFNLKGRYAQIFILLNMLHTKFLAKSEDGYDEYDDIKFLTHFTNWTSIKMSHGQNVIVGNISNIEVPSKIFNLLKKISYYNSNGEMKEISFIDDCFSGFKLDIYPFHDELAKALFKMEISPSDCWDDLSKITFNLYKKNSEAKLSKRFATNIFSYFIKYFAKEIINMDDNQLTACKKVGDLVGNAFSNDVTLISRIYNISSEVDFRDVLNMVTFRLFKLSNSDERQNVWNISPNEIENILSTIDSTDWQKAAQTISIFASLKAFNKNLGGKDNEK